MFASSRSCSVSQDSRWDLPGKELVPPRWLPMLPGHGTLSVGKMSVNNVCVMVPAWHLGTQKS